MIQVKREARHIYYCGTYQVKSLLSKGNAPARGRIGRTLQALGQLPSSLLGLDRSSAMHCGTARRSQSTQEQESSNGCPCGYKQCNVQLDEACRASSAS